MTAKEKRLVDTKAGFFIEEDEEGGTEGEEPRNLVSLPAPITKPDRPECEECGEAVAESFLLRTFDLSVCDSCKGRTDQTQKGVAPLYNLQVTWQLDLLNGRNFCYVHMKRYLHLPVHLHFYLPRSGAGL